MHKVNIRAQVLHHSHHSHLGFEVNHDVLIILCILNLKQSVILFLLNMLTSIVNETQTFFLSSLEQTRIP